MSSVAPHEHSAAEGLASFRILGPVEARIHDRDILLGHSKQRSVLTALLLDANRPVTVATLTARVWGDEPPRSAESSLYSYIARLRSVFSVPCGPASPVRIVRPPIGGYMLELDGAHIDYLAFRSLVSQARATEDPAVAAQLFSRALGLWRGRALDGVDSAWIEGARVDLQDQRVAALLSYQDALVRLNRSDELLSILQETARSRPLDEAVLRAVMRSLMLSGRRAEALHSFAQALRLLRRELGVDPAPETLDLHQEILKAGSIPQTAASRVAGSPSAAPPLEPCTSQLPGKTDNFVGHEMLRQRFLLMLRTRQESPAHRRILIHGPAGVGKTALALHVCNALVSDFSDFPDGQLYVNLGGHQADLRPADSSAVLICLLKALGVPSNDIPGDIEEQSALLRIVLAGKKVLLFLDGAASYEQVAPVMDGADSGAIVVTSRDAMPAVPARHVVERMRLNALSREESCELLGSLVGPQRVAAEAKAAATMIAACGGLPLALRAVAARTASRPMNSLACIVGTLVELDDIGRPVLAMAELPQIRVALDGSYRALSEGQRVLFRGLGFVPGGEFTLRAAAAACDVQQVNAELILEKLASIHLLEQLAPGRYRCIGLVRRYAQERSCAEGELDAKRTIVSRLLAYYLQGVASANPHHQARLPIPPSLRRPVTAVGGVSGSRSAVCSGPEWASTTTSSIFAVVEAAQSERLFDWTWRLVYALRGWFRARHDDLGWQRALTIGTRAAEEMADPGAMAATYLSFAEIYQTHGDTLSAAWYNDQALTSAAKAEWAAGSATAQSGIGLAQWTLGDLQAAKVSLLQALGVFRAIAYQPGEAAVLARLGCTYHDSGKLAQARQMYRQALYISRKIKSCRGEALNLFFLGVLCADLGRTTLALRHLEAAGSVCRRHGLSEYETLVNCRLAALHAALGEKVAAAEVLPDPWALSGRIRDKCILVESLNLAGDALRFLGDSAEALRCHVAALSVARRIRYKRGATHALVGAAWDRHASGQHEHAVRTSADAAELAEGCTLPLMAVRALLVRAESLLTLDDKPGAATAAQQAVSVCREWQFASEEEWANSLKARADDAR